MTTEFFGVISKLILSTELTCVTSELDDNPTTLECVTITVLCFESETVVALLCVLTVLSICSDENLTEDILDPTVV